MFLPFVVVSLVLLGLILKRLVFRPNHPAIPGPKPYPIIGNLFDLPHERQWIKFTEWARLYGEIVHVHTFGTSIIVLNSVHAVKELLERRSAIYSDRPHSVMLCDIMGYEWGVNAMQYGDRWKTHRRILHQSFQRATIQNFWPIQHAATTRLVSALCSKPNNFWEHCKHFSASIAAKSAYGIELSDQDDWFIQQQQRNFEYLTIGATPFRWMVDIIPALRHVPAWVPGAEFKRVARAARECWQVMLEAPLAYAKAAIETGTAPVCLVSKCLEGSEKSGLSPEVHEGYVKNAAGIVYVAGMDTTSSALHAFILAMVLHPEVQRKAQKELDTVLGVERTPSFEDRPNLPYIEAIMSEVLRWVPIAPVALPHVAAQDDQYGEYVIKKGTLVFGNSWALLHDPDIYADPWVFRPERFIKSDTQIPETDPANLSVYGYGRRVCPGRWLADGSVWIAIATILSRFDISPAIDAHGAPIDVSFARDQLPAFNSYVIHLCDGLLRDN
ncbi:CyP450 monooxygenase [Punctularia strigosozonata HHB-11173 SS5]|uniref:CyP450 monooxygenase n=1 Tax=Punctularia strigosozonata (strain HHB-11173) TaxID=741275 RepID=R7S0L7_PUNST|nr:CyP450 monooxygenase [Punctularia strigosozonata HHB-11173 SS5]EIN03940.1 CyP450 monooxygenase [Punctularia strigosozonata HHB-11173 SS5]